MRGAMSQRLWVGQLIYQALLVASSPMDTLGFDVNGHEHECAMMTALHGGGLLPTWADSASCCAWGNVVMCDRDGITTYTKNDYHHGATTDKDNYGGHFDHHKATARSPQLQDVAQLSLLYRKGSLPQSSVTA